MYLEVKMKINPAPSPNQSYDGPRGRMGIIIINIL